jgi:hypothetical protein
MTTEYQTLYNLLAGLASKTPVEGSIPVISLLHGTVSTRKQKKMPKDEPAKDERAKDSLEALVNEVIEEEAQEIVRAVWKSEEMASRIEPIPRTEKTKKEKPTKSLPCTGCFKSFRTPKEFKVHCQNAEMCAMWATLPNQEDYEMPSQPIHLLIDELVTKAVTGEIPLQCRFCKTVFVNKGNHHKHFYNAHVCNRMAYVEFKKIIGHLNK